MSTGTYVDDFVGIASSTAPRVTPGAPNGALAAPVRPASSAVVLSQLLHNLKNRHKGGCVNESLLLSLLSLLNRDSFVQRAPNLSFDIFLSMVIFLG